MFCSPLVPDLGVVVRTQICRKQRVISLARVTINSTIDCVTPLFLSTSLRRKDSMTFSHSTISHPNNFSTDDFSPDDISLDNIPSDNISLQIYHSRTISHPNNFSTDSFSPTNFFRILWQFLTQFIVAFAVIGQLWSWKGGLNEEHNCINTLRAWERHFLGDWSPRKSTTFLFYACKNSYLCIRLLL